MKISDSERLILLMLCEIQDALKIKEETETAFIKEALFGGHDWAFESYMHGLFHGERTTKAEASEVMDILDMWTHIQDSFGHVSDAERKRVSTEAEPCSDEFRGFDGNYEGAQYTIAKFLIEKAGRFTNFDSQRLYSHTPTLEGYRRMLAQHAKLDRGSNISPDALVKLLKLQAK